VSLTDYWAKSPFSGGNGCVETRLADDKVQLRDSKSPADGVITFIPEAWVTVLANVREANYQFEVGGVQFTPFDQGGFTVHAHQDGRLSALSFTEPEVTAFRAGVIADEFDLPVAA
jgi:hypothetical protein